MKDLQDPLALLVFQDLLVCWDPQALLEILVTGVLRVAPVCLVLTVYRDLLVPC